MLIGWQGGGKRDASYADTFSLGGVSIHLAEPLSVGTSVQLLFDVPGGEVRARAIVRHGKRGSVMGVQFTHMESDCRARLHRFLKQLASEQRKPAALAPSSWFGHHSPSPDSGEISTHHELFALLNRIYSARLTGKLQLVLGRVERQLFFDGGQLVFATSSDRQDSLGEMMLRAGALTQIQFEEASELVQTGQRFGSAIAEMGIYTVEEVTGWVQRQLTQITSSVLDYSSCRYYFFSSIEKNVVPEIGIPMPLGKLLLEAVERAKDLPLDHLATDAELWVDLSLDPLLLYQVVDLSQSERCLLHALATAKAAKDLLQCSGLPKERTARSLYNLMVLGTVVCVAQPAPAEQVAASATPVSQPAPASPPAPTSPPPEHAAPPPQESQNQQQFEADIRNLITVAETKTYYELLGVSSSSSPSQLKDSYHRLARKFHPDRHMGQSERLALLQEVMSHLTIAYKTLADDEKRARYDQQLAESGAFARGQSKTESQRTIDDCLAQAKHCLRAHNFAGSIGWLRQCVEIAPDMAEYRALLARSLAALPQYRQEAIQHYEKAIELDAWNTSTYFQLAELYEVMRLPWRSVPLYQKILEIDPEHNKALERLRALEETEQEDREERSFVSRLFHRKP